MKHSTSLPSIHAQNRLLSDKELLDGRRTCLKPHTDEVRPNRRRSVQTPPHDFACRGMSEVLSPVDNDPRGGAWTRWTSTKDESLMAVLDAEFALAEEMLRNSEKSRSSVEESAVVSEEAPENLRAQRDEEIKVACDAILLQTVGEEIAVVSMEIEVEVERAKQVAEEQAREAAEQGAAVRQEALVRHVAEQAALKARFAAADHVAAAAARSAADAAASAAVAEDAAANVNGADGLAALRAKVRAAATTAVAAAGLAATASDKGDLESAEEAVDKAKAAAKAAAAAAAAAVAEAERVAALDAERESKTCASRAWPRAAACRIPRGAWPAESAWPSASNSSPTLSPSWHREIRPLSPFDTYGDGISAYLASAGSRTPLANFKDDETTPLHDSARGCVRFLADTMNGGESHLLPVVAIDDIRDVLHHARAPPLRHGQLRSLFLELASGYTTLFSIAGTPTTPRPPREATIFSPIDRQTAPRLVPPLAPGCPHLLLKRNFVVAHVLNAPGSLELVQSTVNRGAAESASSEFAGLQIGFPPRVKVQAGDRDAVQYRRLSCRLTDDRSPTRLAVDLIMGALGVPEESVRELDAWPTVTRRDPAGCCTYPGLGCEYTYYVVRFCVDQLPPHAFNASRVEWVWVRPRAQRKPETVTWSQRPAAQPQPQRVVEALRRSAWRSPQAQSRAEVLLRLRRSSPALIRDRARARPPVRRETESR